MASDPRYEKYRNMDLEELAIARLGNYIQKQLTQVLLNSFTNKE